MSCPGIVVLISQSCLKCDTSYCNVTVCKCDCHPPIQIVQNSLEVSKVVSNTKAETPNLEEQKRESSPPNSPDVNATVLPLKSNNIFSALRNKRTSTENSKTPVSDSNLKSSVNISVIQNSSNPGEMTKNSGNASITLSKFDESKINEPSPPNTRKPLINRKSSLLDDDRRISMMSNMTEDEVIEPSEKKDKDIAERRRHSKYSLLLNSVHNIDHEKKFHNLINDNVDIKKNSALSIMHYSIIF